MSPRRYREGDRLAVYEGCSYLLPTIVLCESAEHALANREFLFPYASVVPVQQEDIPRALGPSLVVTAITARSRPDREAALLAARGPSESGRNPDLQDQLGPAARRQPVRSPLRPPGVSACGMKILAFTAGAARMYCGSCLRDNALAAELKRQGHDVILLPIYTPTRTDEANVSDARVFMNGITVCLEQQSAFFRKTRWLLDRLWDAPWVMRLAAKRRLRWTRACWAK